jgi:hypothetical protein
MLSMVSGGSREREGATVSHSVQVLEEEEEV